MSPAEPTPTEGATGMLTELLGGVAVGDVGLAGIVVIIVLMILTGKLVPGKRYEEAREDAKAYRVAMETQQAVNAENTEALKELLQLARTSEHALTEIQSLGRRGETRQEGTT